MISIVCVYNNEEVLRDYLLKSLENQTVEFELIKINNASNKFKSAAEALNYGGKNAKGKYIMFVHQDVELGSDSWLESTEKLLDNLSDVGIAGVAGAKEGKIYGYISSCGSIWGKPLQKPEEIQTLDECLFIVPKFVFSKMQFDEKTFCGWHCYGADYCLSIGKMGLRAYVIPAFVYHRSLGSNVKELSKYLKRLYNKHKANYRHIYIAGDGNEITWLKLTSMYLGPIYRKFFPSWAYYWTYCLKRELSDCNTVLDLGYGPHSLIQQWNVHFSVGVELFEPYLEESKKKGLHNQYIKADITKIEFKPKSFDAVVAIEVLEHLTKEEGYELLKKMERWGKKKIIITTPNGYLYQDAYDNNPLQKHRSSWSAEELKKLGFEVVGINGWKKLRGYKAQIKYKPTLLWSVISDITQKITYYYPKFAFQILAVKQIRGRK